MDDALELSVKDNEFDVEPLPNNETEKVDVEQDVKVKLDSIKFDPNDYISLHEAKQELLQSLEQYDLKDDVMLCSRGSVKSRLGVREEGVEFMDCTESGSNVYDYEASVNEDRLSQNRRNPDGLHTKNTATKISHSENDIPRRPSMKNLCKRLRVRWYDSPVKIGKEIAQRLEEHKFSLIIETVKILGGKKTLEIFNETKQIQLNGGMKTANGSRRRTSGGVFFTLLKSSEYATAEQLKKIFKEDMSIKKAAVKRKKAAYNKRKQARMLLKQQEALGNAGNSEQQDSNIAENDVDSMTADGNTSEVSKEAISV